MTLPLTIAQGKILKAIKEFIGKNGYPPTQKEIAEAMGYSSQNAAHEQIKKIEKKGFIQITPGISRGIRVL